MSTSAEDYALGLAQERQEIAHDAAQVVEGAPLIYSACSCRDGKHDARSIAEWVATRYAADSDVLALANVDRPAHITSRTEAEALAADEVELATEYVDHLNLLLSLLPPCQDVSLAGRRYSQCDATCTTDCGACKGRAA